MTQLHTRTWDVTRPALARAINTLTTTRINYLKPTERMFVLLMREHLEQNKSFTQADIDIIMNLYYPQTQSDLDNGDNT